MFKIGVLFLGIIMGSPSSGAHVQSVSTIKSHNPANPSYDVSVVRLSSPYDRGSGITTHMDYFMATNVSLKRLLQYAYGFRERLIFGISRSMDSARLNLTAKVLDPDMDTLRNLTDDQWRKMLQPVLISRFHLKYHIGHKSLRLYYLVKTKDSSHLEVAKKEETPRMSVSSSGKIVAHDVPIAKLAKALSGQVYRPVIDRTGLSGRYSFSLRWSPVGNEFREDSGTPDIFTALKEQLGLKLQSARGLVRILIVDHATMPSEN